MDSSTAGNPTNTIMTFKANNELTSQHEGLPRNVVHFQVGEKRYTIRPDTLATESRFFESLFSGRWSQAEADGSYFIDYDANVFDHILRYCRLGTFPLCIDDKSRQNLALYADILAAAEYFGIDDLATWIKEKKYESVVTTSCKQFKWSSNEGVFTTNATDVEIVNFEIEETKFTCPHGYSHQSPLDCTRDNYGSRHLKCLDDATFHWAQQYAKKKTVCTLVKETKTAIDFELLKSR